MGDRLVARLYLCITKQTRQTQTHTPMPHTRLETTTPILEQYKNWESYKTCYGIPKYFLKNVKVR